MTLAACRLPLGPARPAALLVVVLWAVVVGRAVETAESGDPAETPGVMVVAEAQVGPGAREVRIALTFHNLAAVLGRDYTAFLHFDRYPGRESLYTLPAPGLRPLVAATTASRWGPGETVSVPFPAVTVPSGLERDVLVYAGLYDPAGGGRYPLLGCDASRRVLVGRIGATAGVIGFRRAGFVPPAGTGAAGVGVRPRAFVRPLDPAPAVRFGEVDPASWAVAGEAGGTASVRRTREVLAWSEASLRITYSGTGPESGFVLRAPAPLPIGDEANLGCLWLLGNAIGWREVADHEQPLLSVSLEVCDAAGRVRRLGTESPVNYPYWYVHRFRLPPDLARPAVCTGIVFAGCSNRGPAWLAADVLVFSREQRAASLAPGPALDDALPLAGPDGPVPEPAGSGWQTQLAAGPEPGTWRFEYRGPDGTLSYRYRPVSGGLDDIEAAEWLGAGQAAPVRLRPTSGSGLRLARGGGASPGPVTPGALVEARIEGAVLRTRWRLAASPGPVEYRLDLTGRGKALVADLVSEDTRVAGFSPGRFGGPGPGRWIPFPYWSYGLWDWGRDGGVVLADGLFVAAFPDCMRSAASDLAWGEAVAHDPRALLPGAVTYCPGVLYHVRSDGQRNPLRERFILTVSPEVGEVLPRYPFVAPPDNTWLAPYLHDTGGDCARLEAQLAVWQELAAYGVNKVYIRHFDGMWADQPQGPQEWTLTEHAGPVAGDAAVRTYLDALAGLGFLPVLYTNYTDLQPVAGAFDWEAVSRRSDGEISAACWPGSYPLKPRRAVDLEAEYAPRIARRFGTRGSFCDVHTAVAPWHKVDYDARLPGAGQFGTTYRAYARVLARERATYGAVYSEGSRHWLYAGLADGSDAQLSAPQPHREPFLVDFDLRYLHPVEMDAGMSWISRYVRNPAGSAATPEWQAAAAQELGGWEAALDRFVAATLAFGHQGTFAHLGARGYDLDIRTYYLLQPVQVLFARQPADTIRYHDPDGERLLGTSDALRAGSYRHGQVYVRYRSGLEVWVNGSLERDWQVTVDGTPYALPPSGFVCRSADRVLACSHRRDGGRVDYSRTPDAAFVDARGRLARVGEFETDGAAIVRRLAADAWAVHPLGQVSTLRVNAVALGLPGDAGLLTLALPAGAGAAPAPVRVDDGWVTVPLDTGAVRLDLRRAP